jgi:hypothetical protein
MIKITYETSDEKMSKPEKTFVNIFPQRMFIRYSIQGKARSVVDQMKKDGRTNVLYSRGCLIQIFRDKTEKEILEIAKEDLKNGLYVAESKTGKKLTVKNFKIEEI